MSGSGNLELSTLPPHLGELQVRLELYEHTVTLVIDSSRSTLWKIHNHTHF